MTCNIRGVNTIRYTNVTLERDEFTRLWEKRPPCVSAHNMDGKLSSIQHGPTIVHFAF